MARGAMPTAEQGAGQRAARAGSATRRARRLEVLAVVGDRSGAWLGGAAVMQSAVARCCLGPTGSISGVAVVVLASECLTELPCRFRKARAAGCRRPQRGQGRKRKVAGDEGMRNVSE